MIRLWILIAGLAGLTAVAAGAMAAHALPDARAVGLVTTGAQYAMFHALALLGLAALAERGLGSARLLAVAGWCFVGGIALFSGSLYLLGATGRVGFAHVTPWGGGAFLLGWAALAVYGLTVKRR
jgi:uncharacterized membrane protein YgdD (TMEM256/DUF423 family)